jgi:transcription initiation factor TFIIB
VKGLKVVGTKNDVHVQLIEEEYNRARIGAPASLALYDMRLSTIIGRTNKYASGNVISTVSLSKIERLRTWDSRIHVHKSSQKNFRQAFHQLDELKDKLGLSDAMIEKIAYIYRKVCERRLTHGRTIEGMLAAAAYIVCREMGTPRTIKDIAAALNISHKDISRNCSTLVLELDIKMPLVDPMKCVANVANKLGVSEKQNIRQWPLCQKLLKAK